MEHTSRRDFLTTAAIGAAYITNCAESEKDSSLSGSIGKFFSVGQRNNHWWFISPEGEPFFSIAMNHIDSATLRYTDNRHIWRDRYGNSQKRWIQEAVVPDLKAWGFNSIGWTQEVVQRIQMKNAAGRLYYASRHSRSFTYEEYQWADMPYCHMLPFIESHQWDVETLLPDLYSSAFEDWCDYVAQDDCARMVEDSKLIGYFYTDCPTWIHARNPDVKPPLFDPDLLKTASGKRQLFDLATHYYKVTHDAIRRYDPNHLIFGDRYEGRQPLAEEVLRAAVPYTDVLCFQNFGPPDQLYADFRHWHEITGLPILLADASAFRRRTETYQEMMQSLRKEPFFIGWHYCGAYLKNRCRQQGFRDEKNVVDEELSQSIGDVHRETAIWVQDVTAVTERIR